MKSLNILRCTLALASVMAVTSCSENIDESNLYTFTGETVDSYLDNRDSIYSCFNQMLTYVGHDKMLSTYGTYTLFLPDNHSVVNYLDSLAADNNRNMTGSDGLLYHNGIVDRSQWGTATNAFEALMQQDAASEVAARMKDSLCRDITEFHIITSAKVKAVDMSEGTTLRTLLGRNINTSIDAGGKTRVNVDATITKLDIEVQNGVIHLVDHVLTRSNRLMGGELEQHPEYSLMLRALKETGLIDSLAVERKDKVPAVENTYGFFVPKECRVGFTLFAESDEVMAANGINSFDDLVAYANKTYTDCAAQTGG